MSKINDGQAPGKYTLEFKLEAVRLVEGGQAVPVKARILGVPMQTPGNWVRFSVKGQLKGPRTGGAEGHESEGNIRDIGKEIETDNLQTMFRILSQK